MRTETIPYRDGPSDLEAFVAVPSKKRSPLVILCHAWRGRDEFVCNKVQEMAKWGYVGFALDMYGKGVLGGSKEENAALKRPFIEDRSRLLGRVVKGFEVATGLPYVDAEQVVVIGLGFGGICALDLARSGANLQGAISIYGHFDPPPTFLIKPIKAKVLILHGYNRLFSKLHLAVKIILFGIFSIKFFGNVYTHALKISLKICSKITDFFNQSKFRKKSNDPITSMEELRRFEKEMNDGKVDWQAQIYGNTMHAFANVAADDPDAGILYNPASATRAWIAIQQVLFEIL